MVPTEFRACPLEPSPPSFLPLDRRLPLSWNISVPDLHLSSRTIRTSISSNLLLHQPGRILAVSSNNMDNRRHKDRGEFSAILALRQPMVSHRLLTTTSDLQDSLTVAATVVVILRDSLAPHLPTRTRTRPRLMVKVRVSLDL